MIQIRKATSHDIEEISALGKSTFLETYLPNTPREAVEEYASRAFQQTTLQTEFDNDTIHYFLIFFNKEAIGYGKIQLNVRNEHIETVTLTKLDRLYVAKSFHGQQLGQQLLDYLITFSKKSKQHGMWLYVLIKNERAVRFYQRNHFKVVGEYDFKVSETRYNPNYVMYLSYSY